MSQSSLDATDLRLIRCLQENPRASYAEVARQTGYSETTVRRRVESLFASRMIQMIVMPDIHRLGFTATAYFGLKLDLRYLIEHAHTLREMPEVTFVTICAGGRYDLLFSVACRTVNDLLRFQMERLAPLPGILHMESMILAEILKILGEWRVPVDEIAGSEGEDEPWNSTAAAGSG